MEASDGVHVVQRLLCHMPSRIFETRCDAQDSSLVPSKDMSGKQKKGVSMQSTSRVDRPARTSIHRDSMLDGLLLGPVAQSLEVLSERSRLQMRSEKGRP